MKKFIHILLVLCSAFSLLSFSCSKKKSIGEPYILYEVRGKVTGTVTEDGVKVTYPLKGIKVSSDSSSEPAYTSADGSFVVFGRGVPVDVATLKFEDEDRDSNHGTFLRTSKTVRLKRRDAGDGGNYQGYWYAMGVDVNMLPKNDELNPDPTPGDGTLN